MRLFWIVSVCLVALCALTEIFCARVLHLGHPYNWPLTPPAEHMNDFKEYWEKFDYFHTNQFFLIRPKSIFAYPAPVAVLYKLFLLNPWHTMICFAAFVIAVPVAGASFLWSRSVRLGYPVWTMFGFFASALLLSYPMWFELKQGNLEICIWVLVIAGVCFFLRGRNYSAAAAFGIAGSMKIFPMIYLGLLISKRRFGPMFFGFLVAGVSSVVSLWLLCPDISIALHGIQTGIAAFQNTIVLHVVRREIGFDHSLFAIVKELWLAATGQPPAKIVASAYLAIVAVTGTVLYFTKIQFLPVINQVLCLCIASIVLPPVSYDYTLIHLYLPWGLLVLLSLTRAKAGLETPGLAQALVCMAILFAPESEIIVRNLSIAGQIKAVTLLVLWYVAMKYPFDLPSESLERARQMQQIES